MRLSTALILAFSAVLPAGAADLVEPWVRGISNLELAVAGSAGGNRGASTVLGAGLTDRVSLGLAAGTEEGEDTSVGALLLYSQPLGRAGEVDLWCETSLDALDSTGCGLEWSRAWSAFVPYARLTLDWQAPSDSLVPLAGLMVPITPALGVHFELSLETEEAGRPLRFAVGPNWEVLPRLELLPELAWTRGPKGEDSFDFALCFAMDISRALR